MTRSSFTAIAAFALLTFPVIVAAAPDCTVQDAEYVAVADASFSARFLPVKNYQEGQTLIWAVTSSRTKSHYYLGFVTGNSFVPSVAMIPTKSPLAPTNEVVFLDAGPEHIPLRMEFLTLNSRWEITTPTLSKDDSAPEAIFISGLSQNLYYLRHLMTDQEVGFEREVLPLSVFRMVRCKT